MVGRPGNEAKLVFFLLRFFCSIIVQTRPTVCTWYVSHMCTLLSSLLPGQGSVEHLDGKKFTKVSGMFHVIKSKIVINCIR